MEKRKIICFFEFCIGVDGCRLDYCEKHGYMKGWKYVPLNPEGPHPIPMWQEMHNEEAIISLDHDQVVDLVREGMWLIYH